MGTCTRRCRAAAGISGRIGPRCRRARQSLLLGTHNGRVALRLCAGAGFLPRGWQAGTRYRGGFVIRSVDELDGIILSTLEDREVEFEHPGPGRFFVALPGTKRLKTNCWLLV